MEQKRQRHLDGTDLGLGIAGVASKTSMSYTIVSSARVSREDDKRDSPHEHPIDIVAVSPDQKAVATFSKLDGIVAWWQVETKSSDTGVTSSHTLVCQGTYQSERYKDIASLEIFSHSFHICLSISNEGRFVALSTVSLELSKTHRSPNGAPTRALPKGQKLSTLIVNTETSTSVELPRTVRNVVGYSRFNRTGSLIVCNGSNLYAVSIDTWQLQFVLDMPPYGHAGDTLDISNRINTTINSFQKSGKHFMWLDDQNLISVWSVQTGSMSMRFKYAEGDFFALSNHGELLAVCRAATAKSSSLLIYAIKSGLLVSEYEIPAVIGFIRWTETDEKIFALMSFDDNRDGDQDGTRARFLDPWTGLFVQEMEHQSFIAKSSSYMDPPLSVDGGWFISTAGSMIELNSFSPFHYIPSPEKCERRQSSSRVMIKSLSSGITLTLSRDASYHSLVATFEGDELGMSFLVEPWLDSPEFKSVPQAYFLDENGERVVIIGQQTIQVWFVRAQELQFIWRIPSSLGTHIQEATLHHNTRLTWEEEHSAREEEKSQTHFVRIVGAGKILTDYIVQLPLADGFQLRGEIIYFDRNILINATRALFYMRAIVEKQRETNPNIKIIPPTSGSDFLLKRTRDIIKLGISSVGQPEVFNKVGQLVPFYEFLKAGDLDLVELIIDWGGWVPSTRNGTNTMATNPLAYALKEDMEDLVHKLVKYCVSKTCEHKNQGYMITVAECLEDLCRSYPKLLADMTEQLSNVHTSRDSLPPYDTRDMLTHFSHYEISDVDVFRTISKLQRYNPESILYQLLTRPWNAMQGAFRKIERFLATTFYKEARELEKLDSHIVHLHKKHAEGNLFVVPFPSLCVYETPKNNVFEYLLHDLIQPRSAFTELVDNLDPDHPLFASPIFEAILNFKWHTYAKSRYFFWFLLFLIYFLTFLAVVSYPTNIIGSPWKSVFLDFTVVLAILFLLQEMRQVIYGPLGYITSIYNWIDIGSFALPLVCSAFVKSEDPIEPPRELQAFGVLLLWTNLVLQLRISKHLGIFVAIVLDMIQRILALLFVMAVLVIGFAQAFYILLRNSDQELPEYLGDVANFSGPGSLAPIDLVMRKDKSKSMFDSFDQSLRAVYDFVGGDFSTLDGFRGNSSLDVMVVIFSFMVSIILLNILIALMNESFLSTLKASRRAWLRQMAEVIQEVEIYRMWPWERQDPRKFPGVIYFAKPEDKDDVKSE